MSFAYENFFKDKYNVSFKRKYEGDISCVFQVGSSTWYNHAKRINRQKLPRQIDPRLQSLRSNVTQLQKFVDNSVRVITVRYVLFHKL